ncbi:4-hydroxy-tetrahydrodipicolinate reductase [Calycomorphotria hydatis]|uniref:4-hydroxy-tetrahydrodipicolinate reductase n=1 Tax=Calycomorphotria hydatis TaxID=2528027 RepID=A0A517TCF1_9PLAN|nr:4-hydroxy-tetrahydrodipicolinate reductase [Calycomorphotria hydatis]QDT66040.1 4-hydroxy-tetrahydrodipicolinate reductase [Calycomorphotria hydatis]
MADIRIGVCGAAGRMGRRVVAQTVEQEGTVLAAALDAEGSPNLNQDAGELAGVGKLGVPVTTTPPGEVDVIIDFSTPAGFVHAANFCIDNSIPLVAATTGLTEDEADLINVLGEKAGVVFAPNMSLAVNLTMKLAQEAARVLKDVPGGADVEIIERHHRFKEDAPSGTALHFGHLIGKEMGLTEHVHGRQGRVGKRKQGEIGYHAVRTGDNAGEHTIIFGLLGETVELNVRSHTRDSYALGAVAAAKFLIGKPPGVYGMYDVLGL